MNVYCSVSIKDQEFIDLCRLRFTTLKSASIKDSSFTIPYRSKVQWHEAHYLAYSNGLEV